MNFIINMLAN